MTFEANEGAGQLEILMRVPLRLTAEVGRRQMSIADVLKLGNGSVVELDRAAGDPVDLFAGDRLIARGEIVAVGRNFGVRITELVGRV